MARQVLENGVILPAEYSDDWYDDMTSNLTKLDDVIGSDSEKLSSADVGAAALSNNYNDLDNLPTIPTVNDATLTIQKNGVDVQTFTANASSNVTANITVPTKTSDLTNDSNFVDTSNSAVASGITSAKVTSYDSHIADTDIHVTTADKSKWNTGVSQAYVFRYSSTALVASSTNSNALLDNTDNLKVGDKVIDSSGVLFSITAIDTQNSTFTIGTALVDLANDSDVVHKSGDETISGNKTFSSNVNVYNSDSATDVASIILKNQKVERGGSTTDSQIIYFTDKLTRSLATIRCQVGSSGQSMLVFRTDNIDGNNDNVYSGFFIISYKDGTKVVSPYSSGNISLGTANSKWAGVHTNKINALEPSSLSLPSDRSARIDISSYFTNTGTGDTNTYTVPANGYIFIEVVDCVSLYMHSQTTGNLSNYGNSVCRNTVGKVVGFLPVRKDDVFVSQWYTSATNVTLTSAFFIPCQGNV